MANLLLGLPSALRNRGFDPELIDGWGSRGAGSMDRAHGSISHWTAGPLFRGNYAARPSLRICINGASRGLDNALCNVYLDRRGVPIIVAAGVAWHAGVGSWRGLSGNQFFIGTECEGGGPGDFTPEQVEAYPRLIAAYHDLTQTDPAIWAIGHHEYAPKRKIDVGSYMPGFRDRASAIWRGQPFTPLEDVMTPAQEAKLDAVLALITVPGQGFSWAQANTNRLDKLAAAVTDVRAQFEVPEAPYPWLAALNNKLDALLTLSAGSHSPEEVAQAAVDAKAIADELAKRLVS